MKLPLIIYGIICLVDLAGHLLIKGTIKEEGGKKCCNEGLLKTNRFLNRSLWVIVPVGFILYNIYA